MIRGMIVRSSAGSDKDNFFVVVKEESGRVYISDGKRRKLAAPKSKNPKHLALTGSMVNLEKITTDKALRAVLAEYRSNI